MIAWLKQEHLARVPRPGQWGVLLGVTVGLVALLEWAHLPAALLLGAMGAGIFVETAGGRVRVPRVPFWLAQAVIGCLIARVINPQILRMFVAHWPLFLGVIVAVVAASSALGWLLSKLRILPDTTAIWGLLPGAASAMMIVADAFGADGRLVAFMQYLRVVLVAVAATLIARFWFHPSVTAAGAPAIVWFPAIHWVPFLETAGFIIFCVIVARRLKLAAGFIFLTLALGAVLHGTGWLTIELPQWLLALSYAVLGWNTGLRFNREILAHATRALPQIVAAVLLLMAFCAALAWVLARTAGVDALTAYLATSPGGVDTAAIIAASSKVDMPFVMAMQSVRLLIVLLAGPALSRWVARSVTGGPGRGTPPAARE